MKELEICKLCPRECYAKRNKGNIGICGINKDLYIARIAPHYYEEPSISGTNGSGAIFFSGCPLKCIFCQNYNISHNNFGKKIGIKELANKMLNLQKLGCHNINLVTPTQFIPHIKKAIIIAKKSGLNIPIVYNTSGYEKIESLKLLDGLIDIYLPDFKYFNNKLGLKYSKVNNYFEIASAAINEMYRQVGKNKFTSDGLMQRGIIVRHLLLPEEKEDSKKVLKYLYNKYKDNIYISIMNQYTPLEQVKDIKELNHKVKEKDYDEIINFASDIGIINAYIQIGETQKESYIPEFDLTGV